MLNFIDELKKLNLPSGKYAIFGSGPLAIRNLRDSNDIDIVVKEGLWTELKMKFPDNIKESPLRIEIGNIEIYKDWLELSNRVDFMIDDAEMIEGLPFIRLEYVIEWKKTMNRSKDQRDIELIKQFIDG